MLLDLASLLDDEDEEVEEATGGGTFVLTGPLSEPHARRRFVPMLPPAAVVVGGTVTAVFQRAARTWSPRPAPARLVLGGTVQGWSGWAPRTFTTTREFLRAAGWTDRMISAISGDLDLPIAVVGRRTARRPAGDGKSLFDRCHGLVERARRRADP